MAGADVGGVFLWHFPAGFPGSALPTTLPFDVRTFLEGVDLRDCSASNFKVQRNKGIVNEPSDRPDDGRE
jgi:hypothetical protein